MRFPEIPGYRVIEVIGQGGMATVYKAIQEKLDRVVALKVLDPLLARDPSFARRFLKEALTVGQLSHPNIVTVYDAGQAGDLYYLAMEYIEGPSLRDILKKEGVLSPERALRVVKEIVMALDYAHKKGFVHRDVKPENILFRKDGSAVLSDFGIAKAISQKTQFTEAGFTVGTPQYMSPEQVKGEALDGRSDLYSLGIVLYEMLTGHVPFEGENSLAIGIKHLNEPPPPLPSNLKGYQALIDSLLAKNKEMRYRSAEELVKDIDKILRGENIDRKISDTILLKSTRFIESEKKLKKRKVVFLWLIIGLGLGIVAVIGIYYYVHNRSNYLIVVGGGGGGGDGGEKSILIKGVGTKTISKRSVSEGALKGSSLLAERAAISKSGHETEKGGFEQKETRVRDIGNRTVLSLVRDEVLETPFSIDLSRRKREELEFKSKVKEIKKRIREGKLLLPEEESAWNLLKELIVRHPKNEKLKELVKEIVDRYISYMEKALRRNEFNKAEENVRKIERIQAWLREKGIEIDYRDTRVLRERIYTKRAAYEEKIRKALEVKGLVAKGFEYLKEKRPYEAKVLAERALEIIPDNAEAKALLVAANTQIEILIKTAQELLDKAYTDLDYKRYKSALDKCETIEKLFYGEIKDYRIRIQVYEIERRAKRELERVKKAWMKNLIEQPVIVEKKR